MDIDQMEADLYKAAVEGKYEEYYEALRRQTPGAGGVDVNKVTPCGNTVLHVAALHGQNPGRRKQFVEKILERKEDGMAMLLATNNKNETVLHCAAEKGYADVVSVIIRAAKKYDEDMELGVGAREMIRMRDNVKDTALHKAVRMGHLEVVKLLVKEDAEFEYPANDAGETPIYIAAEFQFYECLVEMLEKCEKHTYGGPLGRNALHATILSGFEPKISLFKINEYLQDSRNKKGYDSKCTKSLLEKEISLCEEIDNAGWTPLHYAVKMCNVEVVGMILEKKTSAAYIHAGNDKEWTTVLHIAAREGGVKTMKHIAKKCPDCWEMMNSKGQNVLHEAVSNRKNKVIKLIEKSNQLDNLVHQKDMDGNTPLHLVDISNFQRLKGIIKRHPKLNYLTFNKENQTLFDRAALERKEVQISRKVLKLGRFPKGRKIPRRLDLTEENTKLRKTEEEEIKVMIQMSETGIIVATLILTMTFAAGFAVPGGYNSERGNPILLEDAAFMIFTITNTFAFLFSACSIAYHIGMVREASSSRKYKTILRLFVLQKDMLKYTFLGVVVAFQCGMYATLAPSPALAISVLVLGFSIALLAFYNYTKAKKV